MSEIYLARQPIFDSSYQLHGYELLFRNGFKSEAEFNTEEQATAQLLLSSIVDIGFDKVTAGANCFINVSSEYADDIINMPLEGQQVILEMRITDVLSDQQQEMLKKLSSKGFKLALDNYHPDCHLDDVLHQFDIIKCNTQLLRGAQLELIIELAKQYKCKTIATHIEEYHQIADLVNLGFDYFQGFFFSKPEITEKTTVTTTLLPVIQTLARILDPDLEIDELEGLISSDVSLSYRVLRLLNSAQYNVSDVDSIKQAIVYLGRDALKNLAIMIVLCGVDEKPSELAKVALVRAKMCEFLAQQVGMDDLSSYFTVGLLSVLDAILDQPMEDVVEELSVNEELQQALLFEGIKGQTLDCVLSYEKCRLSEINIAELEASELTQLYLQAVDWAEQTFAQLSL